MTKTYKTYLPEQDLTRELTLVRRLSGESRMPLNLVMSDNPRMLRRRLYPWYATTMNPYGDIYPCSLQTIMGNVLEEPSHGPALAGPPATLPSLT